MKRLLGALLLLASVSADAQIAGTGSNNGPTFPRRQDDWGMGMGGPFGGSAPSPPVGCDGSIDLSTGCVQPMLGGL